MDDGPLPRGGYGVRGGDRLMQGRGEGEGVERPGLGGLAALRPWSQNPCHGDQVVHEVLEAGDVTALRDVSAQLRGMGDREAKTASATVVTMAMLLSAQFQAIASYALRAM